MTTTRKSACSSCMSGENLGQLKGAPDELTSVPDNVRHSRVISRMDIRFGGIADGHGIQYRLSFDGTC